jgi:hypothetical protein
VKNLGKGIVDEENISTTQSKTFKKTWVSQAYENQSGKKCFGSEAGKGEKTTNAHRGAEVAPLRWMATGKPE